MARGTYVHKAPDSPGVFNMTNISRIPEAEPRIENWQRTKH